MGAHDQRRSGNCAQAKHARDRSENYTDTATEAHKDPVRADRHLCYAQRSRGGRAARPSATTPVRQPHAGRLAVAAPARSGRCRGASCARSPAMLALAAIAQRPRPPPPSSGENPEAGNRNDQAPDKEAVCRECTHGFGGTGRVLWRWLRVISSPVR